MIRQSCWLCAGTLALAGASPEAWAVPSGPTATPDEMQVVRRWTDTAFAKPQVAAPAADPGEGLTVLRQSHKILRNRSVWDTPLKLGEATFAHGFYMDAPAALSVCLAQPGAELTALVGIDDNDDTRRNPGAGSARFHVLIGGRRVFSTPVRRLGDGALAIKVPLKGATQFELEVDDGGDGRGWDQCTWAEVRIVCTDGSARFLDELPFAALPWNASNAPFGFRYDGRASAELLPNWEYAVQGTTATGNRRASYKDPSTGLLVEAEVTAYGDAAAVEWELHLTNTGTADTPIIEGLMALDSAGLPGDGPGRPVTLRWSNGDGCTATSFLPHDDVLAPAVVRSFGARSSDTSCLPFFNLKGPQSGWVVAVGWTGQWQADFELQASGATALRAGQAQTRFRLRPGEQVRTPRILLLHYRGDNLARGHNQFRRLLLSHLVPQQDGQPIQPPVAYSSVAALWLRSTRTKQPLGRLTAASELALIPRAAALGCEAYWMDAYWFPQPWWEKNVGNWYPRPEDFPQGLRPLGDAAHGLGMKFVLWFAPLHVHPTTRWASEHPEFVHGGSAGGAWKLADASAREFLVDWLTQRRAEWGFDVYREDFGTPLPPEEGDERLGVAEMRQIEGFYAFWSALLQRNPGLVIDNCSGGGRRIDMETARLAYTLWRSDFNDVGEGLKDHEHWPRMGLADQVMVSGLSLYFPLHAGPVWDMRPYCFRSAMSAGTVIYTDIEAPGFSADQARQAIAELKQMRPYFLGDVYPLLPLTTSQTDWYACQFDRPDLGAGCALVFRRPESPDGQRDLVLEGIELQATYAVSVTGETYTPASTTPMLGRDLARLTVQIEIQPGSALVRYQRQLL